MKVLVFAHVPPPFHGQSFMVQQLLDVLALEGALQVFHVDCRVSDGTEDVGRFRLGKFFRTLRYCFQAIGFRLRHGVRTFYYVPASPKRTPLYRDWLVMGLCRPFFPQVVFHWHAYGLGEWVETQRRPWEQWLSHRLLGKVRMSLVLGEFNRRDAEGFESREVRVIPNGIPDPCPDWSAMDEDRGARSHRVLFLGLCVASKGVFDALEGVRLANEAGGIEGKGFELHVAGTFPDEAERKRFEEVVARLVGPSGESAVKYHGFVSGETKKELMRHCGILCFPTYYEAESFGLVIVEAMAFGMEVVTTRWRSIPEILPKDYPGLVEVRSPESVARALLKVAAMSRMTKDEEVLRKRFLKEYTLGPWKDRMVAALKSIEESA